MIYHLSPLTLFRQGATPDIKCQLRLDDCQSPSPLRKRRNVDSFFFFKTRKSCFFLQIRLPLLYCSSVSVQLFQQYCCFYKASKNQASNNQNSKNQALKNSYCLCCNSRSYCSSKTKKTKEYQTRKTNQKNTNHCCSMIY